MSYVPPAYNAADFSFTGVAYTPPVAGAADMSWAPVPVAAHVAHARARTPLGSPSVLVAANTWYVVAPNPSVATKFGGATSFLRNRATSLGAIAFFGKGSSPYPQDGSASGFGVGFVGRPIAAHYFQPTINLTCAAVGLSEVRFGETSVHTRVTAAGAGSVATAFGAPTVRLEHGAAGRPPATAFGAARTVLRVHCAGSATTHFGAASAGRTQVAAPAYRPTRWGAPSSLRSDTYIAKTLHPRTVFGQPVASRLNAYRATAAAPATKLGAPACRLGYRALHLTPTTRFGRPLLRRNTQC